MSSMSLAMKARQKVRKSRPPKDRVFGCDLLEHLQFTGQEVPQVLKSCTEFVEHHGIVDGIYRLSGISSNIQKLRQEFDMERSPDLTKEIYLQDIHCVSSLCKAYFRELPNPLLTYQLYDKFAEAVAIQLEEARLVKIKEVLKDLPPPHYRTLEFLMKHLVHMASFSSETNMHSRNLAIVWAPNLLRSKDIETSGFNGTAAFMEVRIQSIVVEFILMHVEQLFQDKPLSVGENESYRRPFPLAGTSGSLPAKNQEELYYRSLSYNIPSNLNQGDGPPLIRPYHTIIDIADQKRKGSLKGKKWKSIFNIGRSNNDSKRRSAKQDGKDDKSSKINLRPAKSMDSLSAMPYTNEDKGVLVSKGSQKIHIPLRHESFDKDSNQEISQSFQESSLHHQSQNEDSIDNDSEPTAKSEPTTPKPSRASLMTNPQGRSPNTNRNRAEKCIGVHISGPFSVTVPFHITSNLTLSRLTRGLECPALSNSLVDKEEMEALNLQESGTLQHKSAEITKAELQKLGTKEDGNSDKHNKINLRPTKSLDSLSPVHFGKGVGQIKEEIFEDAENCRLSMAVHDSFSFLDVQDTSTEIGSPEESQVAHHTAKDQSPSLSEEEILSFPSDDQMNCFPFALDLERVDEDFGSGYVNDIMVSDKQVAEFSVEPPAEDMCSEDECDQQYFDPTGCLDNKDPLREEEEFSEDVFLSAYDDLSPIMKELEPLSELAESQDSQRPGAGEELPINWNFPSQLQSGILEGVELVATSDNLLQDVAATTIEMPSQNPSDFLKKGLETINSCSRNERTVEPKLASNDLEESAACNDKDTTMHTPVNNHQIDEMHKEEKEDLANGINCSLHTRDTDSATKWDTFVIVDAPPKDQKKDIQRREIDYQHEIAILELDNLVKALNQLGDEAGLSTQSQTYDEIDGIPKYCRPSAQAVESVSTVPNKTVEVEQSLQGPSEGMHYRSMAPNYSSEDQEKNKPPRFYPDGSISMRLISTYAHIQQVKSLPVVPPKPQFAKLPPELKSKIHVEAASICNRDAGESESLKHGKTKKCHSVDLSYPSADSPQKQQRSGWRDGGSVSFDTGTAQAKDKQTYQLPVRRMQTYSIGDSHESHDASKSHVPRLNVKPLRHRLGRPVSCLGSPTSPKDLNLDTTLCQEAPASLSFDSRMKSGQESFTASQEYSLYNRLSLPRIGRRLASEEKGACLHQQRRSIV